MIVLGKRKDLYQPLIRAFLPISLVLFFVSIVFLGLLLFYFRRKESQPHLPLGSLERGAFSYQSVGNGFFSLRENRENPLLNLDEELQLYALNTRPDARQLEKEMGQPGFLIAFRGHSTPIALRSGQAVYFQEQNVVSLSQQSNGPRAPLMISSSPTSWKIQPMALEDRIFIEVESNKEKTELLLQESSSKTTLFHERARGSGWYKALKAGKFWTPDRFSAVGKESSERLFKIGFGAKNAGNVVVCTAGDYLFFASGQWQAGQLAFAKGRPLAKILSSEASGMSIKVWDETGFFCDTIAISPIPETNYDFTKPETLFSSLKQRNSSEVSCIMGKRRVVLKTGTWWIKSLRGWHRLKRSSEIEDYLSYRLLGELIAIDGLESFQGRTVIKGRLIDPLRLHVEPFSLQVADSPGRTNKSSPAAPKEKPLTEKRVLKPQSASSTVTKH